MSPDSFDLGNAVFANQLYNCIRNRYYGTIIYLCLNYSQTYESEVRKIAAIPTITYFRRLLDYGIIQRKKSVKKEVTDNLKFLNGMGNHTNQIKFYELTDYAKSFLSNPDNYQYLIDSVDIGLIQEHKAGIVQTITDRKMSQIKNEQFNQLQRAVRMKNAGIELEGADLELYNSWRFGK